MKKVLLLALLLAACGKKAAKKIDAGHTDVQTVPTATEPPGIRLPDGVTPLAYRLAITEDPTQGAFHGTVEIDVTIDQPLGAIWLHAADEMKLTDAQIVRGEHSDALSQTRGKFERVALTGAGEQPAGPATLKLTFDGVQDPDRGGGVRRRQDGGDWYVVTQHEATSARRTFPCFDEPRWKVPFTLTLTVPAADLAVANMPIDHEDPPANGLRAVHFTASPPMPTYLTAFAVGPFEAVDAGKSRTGTPIRIIVPRGRGADAAYAAAELPRIQAALEDYTGSPYPYAKLDHLVIPSQPRGAMENPGMITYPPKYLLVSPDESIAAKALIAGIAAHEIAHMWFGDLVTMQWWDDVWLNEAFATWASSKIVGQLYPQFSGHSIMANERRTALEADGKASSRKIRQPVDDEGSLDAAFDGITYQKGATVIRMFETWLGEDVFQQGVRAYLAAHAWKNATAADFLGALDAAAGKDVATPFSTFLDQPGAPVVEMAVDCPEGGGASLHLHQRRHLLLGAADPGATSRWQIPVCVRTSEDPNPKCTLLTEDDGALDLGPRCPKWVEPNAAGAGYYRAALAPPYDRTLLDAPRSPKEIAAGAVDLSLAVDAGEVGLDVLLAALPGFAGTPERVTREVAVARLEGLVPMVTDADRDAFAALVSRTFLRTARDLDWVPRPSDTIADATLRGRILGLVATAGEGRQDATGFAYYTSATARGWAKDHALVPASLWPNLLGAAIRAHPEATFDLLFPLATKEPDPAARRAVLAALAEVEDVPRLTKVLDLLLADDPTPFERVAVLGGAHTPETQAAVLDYIEAHLDGLLAHLGDDWHGRLVYAPCLADRRSEIADWLQKDLAVRPEVGALPVTQAIEAMDQCLAVRSSLTPQLEAALRSAP